jgi:hypothetical protein
MLQQNACIHIRSLLLLCRALGAAVASAVVPEGRDMNAGHLSCAAATLPTINVLNKVKCFQLAVRPALQAICIVHLW